MKPQDMRYVHAAVSRYRLINQSIDAINKLSAASRQVSAEKSYSQTIDVSEAIAKHLNRSKKSNDVMLAEDAAHITGHFGFTQVTRYLLSKCSDKIVPTWVSADPDFNKNHAAWLNYPGWIWTPLSIKYAAQTALQHLDLQLKHTNFHRAQPRLAQPEHLVWQLPQFIAQWPKELAQEKPHVVATLNSCKLALSWVDPAMQISAAVGRQFIISIRSLSHLNTLQKRYAGTTAGESPAPKKITADQAAAAQEFLLVAIVEGLTASTVDWDPKLFQKPEASNSQTQADSWLHLLKSHRFISLLKALWPTLVNKTPDKTLQFLKIWRTELEEQPNLYPQLLHAQMQGYQPGKTTQNTGTPRQTSCRI